MIVKVKEPLPPEYDLLKEGQTLFTYLHLAPDPDQTQALLRRKVTGIAYETVQLADGSLPLLAPMSEVAGACPSRKAPTCWSPTWGQRHPAGGRARRGAGHVVIIGGGNVGTNAAKIAVAWALM